MEEVKARGLCTLCGACAQGCPYLLINKDRLICMDDCIVEDGQCYKYCPRTPSDIDAIYRHIFGKPFGEENFGAGVIKDVFLARTTDKDIARKAQDGGSVTTLLTAAIQENVIDCALVSKRTGEKPPQGALACNKEELLQCAGSSYEMSPVLETLNRISKDRDDRLGVVGLPCQVMAIAKMKADPPQNRVKIGNIKLVIGLFCGWSLTPEAFIRYLQQNYDLSKVTKHDIPHHPAHSFDLYTDQGKIEIDLNEIRDYINPACNYCWDMTSQFADISVGSGRAMFRGWNTVVVRTDIGARVAGMAIEKGLLETQPIPPENVEHLQKAALDKAKRAVRNIVGLTGSRQDLGYLQVTPEIREKLMKD